MLTLKRKLTRSSRVKPSILFYSHKMKSMQYCESRLEQAACLLREFDQRVAAYVTQPHSFNYDKDDLRFRYTPDCLIKTIDGDYFYEEIKPYSEAQKESFKERFLNLQDYFNAKVKRKLVLNLSHQERADKTISNLQFLYKFRQKALPLPQVERTADAVKGHTKLTFGDLRQTCEELELTKMVPYQLLAHQHFSFDHTKTLSNSTILEK